jgi:cytochrome c oxidase cbb3-type subunit III
MNHIGTHNRQWTRATMPRARVCLACCLLLSAAGCDFPGKPNPADRPVPPRDVLEFSLLYKQNCAGCHGADGELGAAPPLRDPLFRAIVPKENLERTIAKGRPGTPMPAFAVENGGTLSPAQIRVLVFEIKGIRYKTVETFEPAGKILAVAEDANGAAPKWGPLEPPLANIPPYLAADAGARRSTDTFEQIRKTTFARACAGCHGDRGQGGDMAHAINAAAFLDLASDQVLRRLIITGRPDLGMPDFATGCDGRPAGYQPLSAREIADLVALFGDWRQSAAPNSKAETHNANKLKLDAANSSRTSNLKADRDGKSS